MIILPGNVYIDSWFDSEGLTNNAAANTILADTGELDAGLYEITVFITYNNLTPKRFIVQHRNAANDDDIWSQLFYCSQVSGSVFMFFKPLAISDSERLRVLTLDALTGYSQAAVNWVLQYDLTTP